MTDAIAPSSSPSPNPEPPRGLGRLRNVYYGYWLVIAAFLAQFVGIGSMNYVIGAFLNPMTQDFDWSHSEFTLARTLGQFVLAATGLVIGVQVDRHGGRMLLRVGIVILATAMFACAYVQELWQWWLLNGVMLTTGSAMIGNLVVNVTLAKWFVERRGRVIGIASMGVSFGGIIITPFTAILIDALGWRDAWRILAACAFLIVFPLSFIMRRAPEDYGLNPDGRSAAQVAAGLGRAAALDFANSLTRSQALRTSSFYMVAIAFGLGVLSVQVILIQAIAYMTSSGHSETFGAFMITMTSIPATFLKPVWGFVLDKLDVQRVSLVGFFFNALGLFVIVIGVRAGLTPAIAAGFFLLGIGWSGFIPIQEVIWATFFGRRYLGAVRSAGLPLVFAFSAGGPLLSALYYDRFGNYDGAFLTIAVLTLVGGVLLALARRPVRTVTEV